MIELVSPEAAYQAFWWKWTAIATLILFVWSALFLGALYLVVTKPIVAAISRHLDYWKGQ